MVWQRISRIFIREGARPQVFRFLFKAFVQLVLLFGTQNWVVTPHMVRYLGGFQYQVVRVLMGRIPWCSLEVRWEDTLMEAARAEAGFETMKTYIRQRQNMVAQYIVMKSIMELCEAAERNQGARVEMRWW